MATNPFFAGFDRNKQQGTDSVGSTSAFQAGMAMGQQKKGAAKAKSTLKKAQQGATPSLQSQPATAMIPLQPIKSFKKGGHVRKTGLAFLHRGEHVIPAKQSRKRASSKRTTIKP